MLPDVRRFESVAVSIDQAVFAHRRSLSDGSSVKALTSFARPVADLAPNPLIFRRVVSTLGYSWQLLRPPRFPVRCLPGAYLIEGLFLTRCQITTRKRVFA